MAFANLSLFTRAGAASCEPEGQKCDVEFSSPRELFDASAHRKVGLAGDEDEACGVETVASGVGIEVIEVLLQLEATAVELLGGRQTRTPVTMTQARAACATWQRPSSNATPRGNIVILKTCFHILVLDNKMSLVQSMKHDISEASWRHHHRTEEQQSDEGPNRASG